MSVCNGTKNYSVSPFRLTRDIAFEFCIHAMQLINYSLLLPSGSLAITVVLRSTPPFLSSEKNSHLYQLNERQWIGCAAFITFRIIIVYGCAGIGRFLHLRSVTFLRHHVFAGKISGGQHCGENRPLRTNRPVNFDSQHIGYRYVTFNFRRALNFFKQSTVSCRCTTEATRSLCCETYINYKLMYVRSMCHSQSPQVTKRKSILFLHKSMDALMPRQQ